MALPRQRTRRRASSTLESHLYYIEPDCHHHIRSDPDILSVKIADGRAYWASAMDLWCVSRNNSEMLLLAQPSTVGNDYFHMHQWPGVDVHEYSTNRFDDTPGQLVRLITRNMKRPALRLERRLDNAYAHEHGDAGSWRPFTNACEAIANAERLDHASPDALNHRELVELFASNWHKAGHPVPPGYHAADGLPPSDSLRRYQREEGRGRQRAWAPVIPHSLQHKGNRTIEPKDLQWKAQRTFIEHTTPRLTAAPPDTLAHVVVPTRIVDGEVHVHLPPGGLDVWGITAADVPRQSAALLPEVGRAVARECAANGQPTVLRAGTSTEGKKLLAAIVEPDTTSVTARKTKRSWTRRLANAAMWCTLSVLAAGTPQTYWAQVAACTVKQFATRDALTTPMTTIEDAARTSLGVRPGVGFREGPRRDHLHGQGITPRDLLAKADRGIHELRHALVTRASELGGHYAEWSESITPLPIEEVPSDLWDVPLRVLHGTLDSEGELFSPRLPAYDLPWLPRMPRQPPLVGRCEQFAPSNATAMLLPSARQKLSRWLEQTARDLQCLEEKGAECDRRHKPPTIVIGQDELVSCARGRIWNCTSARGCRLRDFGLPLGSHLNLEYLAHKFQGYPDQRLASNILEGVRLEADIELQIVLQPNNANVNVGYASVQKTVRELQDMGFYEFHLELPFVPMNVVGQGSRLKKLGVNKYRRTSDFSAPYKVVKDGQGKRTIPINESSKTYQLPSWFGLGRPDLLDLDSVRYSHVRWKDKALRSAPTTYKFPKEQKPLLVHVMRDGAILLGAAVELDEPIFVWVSDAAYYFNQFAYAPEELWKSTLVVGGRATDHDQHGRTVTPHQPLFVAERRLGFGSYASSNIAQRFSNALVEWTLRRFDELENEAIAMNDNLAWQSWRARRDPLAQRCHTERPRKSGQATADCNQSRLGTIHMYTDDPVFIVVGVERALRLMRAWHEITQMAGVVMACPEKRQLGGGVEWVGVVVLIAIGLVIIPRSKLLRARQALLATLEHCTTFDEYRALVGLLEHLRFIAQLEAESTNALYRPHGRNGESCGGPNSIIKPDQLMIIHIHKWLEVIMTCAGATCTLAFRTTAAHLLRTSMPAFHGSSDAAGDGRGTPGIGGYMHGHYWRMPLSEVLLPLLHITAWEMLAAAVNILVAARLGGADVVLLMRSDAALVHTAIARQKSKSHAIQLIIHHLLRLPRYQQASTRLLEEHLNGDGNIFSDLVSRALWDEFERLCATLRIRPTRVDLDTTELELVRDTLLPHAHSREARRAIDEIANTPDTRPHPEPSTAEFTYLYSPPYSDRERLRQEEER